MVQPRLFAGAQVKMDDVGKVSPAVAGVQPQARRLPKGDLRGTGPHDSLGRKREGMLDEPPVEQRHARLEPVRHRRAVHQHQVVVGQVGVDVQIQEPLDQRQVGPVELPEEPGGIAGRAAEDAPLLGGREEASHRKVAVGEISGEQTRRAGGAGRERRPRQGPDDAAVGRGKDGVEKA